MTLSTPCISGMLGVSDSVNEGTPRGEWSFVLLGTQVEGKLCNVSKLMAKFKAGVRKENEPTALFIRSVPLMLQWGLGGFFVVADVAVTVGSSSSKGKEHENLVGGQFLLSQTLSEWRTEEHLLRCLPTPGSAPLPY